MKIIDGELQVLRVFNQKPKEKWCGPWEKGKMFPLYSIVERNGSTFKSLTAKPKDEPYVIYDPEALSFHANEGWKLLSASADSRLTGMAGRTYLVKARVSEANTVLLEQGTFQDAYSALSSGSPVSLQLFQDTGNTTLFSSTVDYNENGITFYMHALTFLVCVTLNPYNELYLSMYDLNVTEITPPDE